MTRPEVAHEVDVAVIGGGMGGLLAGVTAARRGRSVLLVERLPYLGGRFTTVPQEGCEITTGAMHLAPHGARGSLGRALREAGLDHPMIPLDAIASFQVDGRVHTWRQPWDLVPIVGARGGVDIVRILSAFTANRGPNPTSMPFATWLASMTDNAVLVRVFERFIEFSVGVHTADLTWAEVRAFFERISRYGFPEVPLGGCRGLVERLSGALEAQGGRALVGTEALSIERLDGASGGYRVSFSDRSTGQPGSVIARTVASDVGADTTARLLEDDARPTPPRRTADGLKLHVLSDIPLLPHNGILFTLDTERIAGIVEVSRSVPGVAPRGMHLLNTFQVLGGGSIEEERALAVEDMRRVFGADFDRHCRIVRVSAFRNRWPVNHAAQGLDGRVREPLPGLLLVGDGYKPAGHIMVEGVAESVRRISARL